MTSFRAILVLAFFAAAFAAPGPSNVAKCSTECPIAGSPKLAYVPEKTYVYSHTGKSRMNLKDVEGGQADMEWSSQVELTWLTPCDMAISIKNPSIAGDAGSAEAKQLETYPLVVAVVDGRVQHACHHPDDDTWSINLKRGIASAFQNSLPSNSSINSGLNVTETDIIGNCSTLYEVRNQGEMVIVEKTKNHRFCQDYYVDQAETPKAWPKAPLPIEESVSECKQEIKRGIYSTITWKDKNIIRPAFGSYRYIEAHQEATLKLQTVTDQAPPSISQLHGLIRKSLRYDHETQKKDPSMVSKVEQELKTVCEKTKQGIKEDAATHVAKAIHYLRRIPEEKMTQILQKIRSGQICGEHEKLEGLFLDALAFIREPGAVKVMVQELLSGKATGGRAALYAAAMYLTPRPCIHSVEALKPLFENMQRFPKTVVAASSMVNTYCKQNPGCQEETAVRQLAQTLSTKVEQQCSPPGNEQAREEALVLLKALGNMGVMDSEIARPIIQCIKKEEADNSIRMTATQAFRNVQCHPWFEQVTKQLVDIALDHTKGTEARIGSYLAAMKCPNYNNLRMIVDRISREENTQVRGFILSHLKNVQASTAPHKDNLRYLVTSMVLPSNFTSDIRKYSRHMDLSYYMPTFGVGAGLESNVIYAPGSYLPRLLNLNLTAAVGATPLNMGEIGARVEGLEPILEEVFGPEGYLKKTPMSEIFNDVSSSIRDKLSKIMERLQGSLRLKRSIGQDTLNQLFDKLYGNRRSRVAKADLYARMNGQEMAFASLSGDMKNFDVDNLINSVFDSVEAAIQKFQHADIDVVRTVQLFREYHLPTTQGMPVKMQLEATAVAGLQMETKLNGESSANPNVITFIPSISTQADGFIGFDFHVAQAGIRMRNRVATNAGVKVNVKSSEAGFDIELDLPQKMELINVQSETYLFKAMQGQAETKINPPSVRSTRFQTQSCLRKLESMIGLKLCYDINMPNVFRSEGLPLGPPAVAKLFIEKSDPSLKGYHMKARVQNVSGNKHIKMEIQTTGSSSPMKLDAIVSYISQEENKKLALEVGSQTSGSVKIGVNTKWTESEKMIELETYCSPTMQYTPETKAIEAKFMMRNDGQEMQVDSHFRTLNAVKKYVEVNFEAMGDMSYIEETSIPVPNRLRQFDFKIASRGWHMISYIKKTAASHYTSAFKCGRQTEELIAIEANHKVEGSSYWDLTIETDMKAKLGRTQYDTRHAMYMMTNAKVGMTLQVSRQGESTKIIELEMLITRPGDMYKLEFLVDIPTYIKAMKIQASAAHQGSSQYKIEVTAKHGESPILQVEGPVTAVRSSTLTQLQTQLRMQCMNSKPYTVITHVVFSQNKNVLSLEIKNPQESMLTTEWTMVSQAGQETKVDFKLILPTMIEKSLNVIISEKFFHMTSNLLVVPKSSSKQRMKGFVDIDFESKKAQGEFAWDADRSPNKKVKATATIASGSATLRNMNIKGQWTYMERVYQFDTQMSLADPTTWFNGRNTMKLDLTTPSHKTYTLNCVLVKDHQTSRCKVDTKLMFKNTENEQYSLESETEVKWLGGRYNMELRTTADITHPQGHQTKLTIESKHQKTHNEREAIMTVEISSASLQQPLKTEITLTNQQTLYSAKWVTEEGSPADCAMYELRLSPEGGVQSFKALMKLKEISQLMKSIEAVFSQTSSSMSAKHLYTQSTYEIQYDNHAPASHSVLVKMPSRIMEGNLKYASGEYLLRLVPHKGASSSIYEIQVNHTQSTWGESSKVQCLLKHPSLEKDLQANVQYGTSGQKITGSLELDIFPNPEDKITGKLESLIFAKNTVQVEAQLISKAMKVNPRVVVAAAYGPSTTGFDIMFQKTPSSPISFLMSTKLDMSFGRNAVSSLLIQTEGQTVMDIAASVRRHQTPTCYGMKVEAKAFSSVIGKYDVFAKMCEPLFVEVITMKHDSDLMYVTKVGVKGLKKVEMSISEAQPSTLERRVVGMVQMKLISPSLVMVETKYENEKVSVLKDSVHDKWSRLISSAGTWFDKMGGEVLKEGGSSSPSSQMSMLWREIKAEAARIYADMKYDLHIPSYETVKRWSRSEIIQGVATAYSQLWSQYSHLQSQIASSVTDIIRTMQTEFEDVTHIIIEAVIGCARSIQTGEMPEGLQRIWEQFQETSLYRVVKEELDSVWNQYPEDYQGMKQIIEKIKHTLAKDFEKQRNNLLQLSKPKHIINWIVNHLNFDRMVFKNVDKVVKQVVEKALYWSVQIEGNHMKLQLPIRRPVNSLPQAVSYATMNPIPVIDTVLWSFETLLPMPIDNFVWTYYSLLPRHARYLLPPFNHTAMVVDGTEILTFDGTVLRTPHSSCKVLLAQYKSHSLIMENPQSAPLPHLTLKASDVKVETKPDFTVTLNGQPISGSHEVEGKVKIYKTPEVIVVKTRFIMLRVYKKSHTVSVEASGWTFGQMAGLLGTYDGEMGNDWMTSRGTRASNLQELVRSWQEDQQCQTPNVSPMSPLQTPVVHMMQCNALLGVRSRCNPIVRQEPFMKMCLASKNACNVAMAYSAICTTKGVRDVFPLGC